MSFLLRNIIINFYDFYWPQRIKRTHRPPDKLLEQLEEPDVEDCHQEQVLGYPRQYIGSMGGEEVRRFLRFASGIPVCTSQGILISFNKQLGAGRVPFGHKCSSMLALSSSYNSFEEFTELFSLVTRKVGGCMTCDFGTQIVHFHQLI